MTKSDKKTRLIIVAAVVVAALVIGYITWSSNSILPGGTTEGPAATEESSAGL